MPDCHRDSIPDLPHEEEVRLVRETLLGDDGAFRILHDHFHPGLLDYIRRNTATLIHVEPEDVTQNVWLYLLRRLDRYDEQYRFGQFLYGIAKNIIRRARREKKLVLVEEIADLERRAVEAAGNRLGREGTPAPTTDWLREHLPGSDSWQDDPDEKALFAELLELTLRHGGYPHQVLSFSFSILVYGKAKKSDRKSGGGGPAFRKVDVTGDPDKVADRHARDLLDILAGLLADEIARSESLEEEAITSIFERFDERLRLDLGALMQGDGTSRKLFARMLEREAGHTALGEYFGKDPRKSVADWTHAVKRRVRNRIEEERKREFEAALRENRDHPA